MAFNNGPRIVTDGLVLSLDAADRNSYPGSGDKWYDVSGNERSITLTNGPVWNSAGYFTFDGTNDYASGSATDFNFNGNTGYSLQAVIMPLNVSGRSFILSNQIPLVFQGINVEFGTAAGNWTNTIRCSAVGVITPPSTTGTTFDARLDTNAISNNNIYILSTVMDYTNKTYDIYLNGILQTKAFFPTPTTAANWNVNQIFYLGGWPDIPLYGNMRYYNLMLHNRLLSQAEILQNYNALKSRFNL
jgi:hypothetical protein